MTFPRIPIGSLTAAARRSLAGCHWRLVRQCCLTAAAFCSSFIFVLRASFLVPPCFTWCAPHFSSLNDDMSGGMNMSFALEVFLCVGFGEIVAPLRRLIYGRCGGELSGNSGQRAVGSCD